MTFGINHNNNNGKFMQKNGDIRHNHAGRNAGIGGAVGGIAGNRNHRAGGALKGGVLGVWMYKLKHKLFHHKQRAY